MFPNKASDKTLSPSHFTTAHVHRHSFPVGGPCTIGLTYASIHRRRKTLSVLLIAYTKPGCCLALAFLSHF
jgi:hypothetical protein